MSLEIWIIIILAMLFIAREVHWTILTHRLVNKLMSRNFAEYQAVVQGPPKREEKHEDLALLEEEQSILNELNAMLPS